MNSKAKNTLTLIYKVSRYNLKIIFANKFIYLLLAAIGFFLLEAVISLLSDTAPTEGSVYYFLMVPGLLLIFYPTTFGIQNDLDSRMLEMIFGIPNYRFKVYLVRMALIYVVVFAILILLSLASSAALVSVPILEMVYQIMFPIFCIGCIAFFFSTLVRNGYGTAVIMIVIGIAFWVSAGILENSAWNIFLNPLAMPEDMNEVIWADIVIKNRIYLAVGTFIFLIWGLLLLQKREKFVG